MLFLIFISTFLMSTDDKDNNFVEKDKIIEKEQNIDEIYIWHSFRGNEKLALEYIEKIYNIKNEKNGIQVKLIEIGSEIILNEIETKPNYDTYPDIFIWAHDKIGLWVEEDLIIPLDDKFDFAFLSNFISTSVNSLNYVSNENRLYGLPISIECLVLYYNKDLLDEIPKNYNELLESAKRFNNPEENKFGLLYQIDNFYYHSLWLHSFKGRVFDENNNFIMTGEPIKKSLELIYNFRNKYKIVPNVALGTNWWEYKLNMFNNNNLLYVISGPWLLGSLSDKVNWGIMDFPKFDDNNHIMPFLGVKALFVTNKDRDEKRMNEIVDVLNFFSSERASIIMGNIGGYIPANLNAYNDDVLNSDENKLIIRNQAMRSVPMPNNKEMEKVWRIMQNESDDEADWGILKNVIEDRISINEATKEILKRFTD